MLIVSQDIADQLTKAYGKLPPKVHIGEPKSTDFTIVQAGAWLFDVMQGKQTFITIDTVARAYECALTWCTSE